MYARSWLRLCRLPSGPSRFTSPQTKYLSLINRTMLSEDGPHADVVSQILDWARLRSLTNYLSFVYNAAWCAFQLTALVPDDKTVLGCFRRNESHLDNGRVSSENGCTYIGLCRRSRGILLRKFKKIDLFASHLSCRSAAFRSTLHNIFDDGIWIVSYRFSSPFRQNSPPAGEDTDFFQILCPLTCLTPILNFSHPPLLTFQAYV